MVDLVSAEQIGVRPDQRSTAVRLKPWGSPCPPLVSSREAVGEAAKTRFVTLALMVACVSEA